MDIDAGNLAATLVSGTVVGIIIGYAVKKVLRIGLIILGIFFAGLAYLQFQGILNVDWDKIELVSKNTIMTVMDSDGSGNTANSIFSNFGLPLTGSIAVGFAVGFMKG
jgi:uncharacterized membrane protein (Fun14 family)